VAETNGLLNRRTGKSGTESSNLSVSAMPLIIGNFPHMGISPLNIERLRTVGAVPTFVPIARCVAQEMVVYYRRPGGQSQFSALLDWIHAHLDQQLTVETLAEQVAMSPRNFSRAFTREMGMSPAKAVGQ
jgi:hypothetical protein